MNLIWAAYQTAVCSLLSAVLYCFCGERLLFYGSGGKKRRLAGLFILIPLLIIAGLHIFINLIILNHIPESNDSIASETIILVPSILFLICIAAGCLFFKFHSDYSEVSKVNSLTVQNESLNKYILFREKAEEDLRIMNHDMKHYLAGLRLNIESGDIDAALKSIDSCRGSIAKTAAVDAGLPIVTAMVNNVLFQAKENDIAFHFSGYVEHSINMEPFDLGILLGNVFDNAFEASLNIKDEKRRSINIKLSKEGEFLIIDAENAYESRPLKKNDFFLTAKKNPVNHGLGTKSIKRTVKKYGGCIENTFSDNVLKVFIILPVYKP